MTIKYKVGQKYNRLTIKSIFKKEGSHGRHAACICDCGNKRDISLGSLGSGHSKSCGCLHKEIVSALNKTHGMTAKKIYSVWEGMIQRCGNEKSTGYKNYGGRGVTVCDKWKDFNVFYLDMGDAPEDKTLDRIDNDQGYSKDNCRWATYEEQCVNKRMRTDNKTGVRGVFWNRKIEKWEARIRRKRLGQFNSFSEACKVRTSAENDLGWAL